MPRVGGLRNISEHERLIIASDFSCGPSCVFVFYNNNTSCSAYPRKMVEEYTKALLKKWVSIGANGTIFCGITIGEHALANAGAVVTKDVTPYAVVHKKNL